MKVVVIASRKGGSGKTTLAGHLAVQAERGGQGPAALIDVDPQGSLSEWWNKRTAETPVFAHTNVARLPRDIERLRDLGIQLLVIDTPPALTSAVGDVVGLADLVVIPSRPSPHDLRSIGATAELVERLGRPLVFVINSAVPRARITNEAIEILSRHGVLAPVIVHHRVDFAASMIDGRTVMELPGSSKSSDEIERLWSYLQARLLGQSRPTHLPALPALGPAQRFLATSGSRA
jgi:chromosome partitioning protein